MRLVSVAYVEQIAQHLHRSPLLTVAQQRADGNVQKLSQQIQQRRFHCCDGVNSDAQIEGLLSPSAGVEVDEPFAHDIQQRVVGRDGLAHDQWLRFLQRKADRFAAGHFSDASVAGVVSQYDDVPGEQRAVRAAQIEQHAVFTGHRYHKHLGDEGCGAPCAGVFSVLDQTSNLLSVGAEIIQD